VIKLRRIRRAGHVTLHRIADKAYKNVVGKSEREGRILRPKCGEEGNVKEGCGWIHLT